MSGATPIVRLGRCLLVTMQGDVHDDVALRLKDALARRIVDAGARGVLLDLSAVDVVDSFIARTLVEIAAVARILDAATVVVGMRPAVAITLVELGMGLDGVRTALDVDRGIALLRAEGVVT